MEIEAPTQELVERSINRFDGDERFFGNDAAVNLVFRQWPNNTSYNEILIKVVVLNRLYSTNIYDVYAVAAHIRALDIDTQLASSDLTLVNSIANVKLTDCSRNFLSFASKYCAWHNPTGFQIFDNLVERLLWWYQRSFGYSRFRRYELRNYEKYVSVVDDFRRFFKLEYTRKQLDKFLWISAKIAQASGTLPF